MRKGSFEMCQQATDVSDRGLTYRTLSTVDAVVEEMSKPELDEVKPK